MFHEIQKTLMRWILGISLFGIAIWSAKKGCDKLDPTYLVIGFICLVIGLIAVWESLFAAATRPFMALIESIVFPVTKFNKPLLNLKLPAYYIDEGRYDEALIEYRKIIKYHPDETGAYEKAIWLHVEIFEEPEEAMKLFNRAKKRNIALSDQSRSLVKIGQKPLG